MPCTTILVGPKASYDGSTIIARNDDAGSESRPRPKKYVILDPKDQPRIYESVLSKVRIPLPDNPMRISAIPNATEGIGIWAACGVNEANVGMTATETITSNERVLAADPLVEYDPSKPDVPGGIGEEDMVVLVLPYIHSAREGVRCLGYLLETWGTYEMNGIAFSDSNEIWWMETIGGHHWMARRLPDDCYAVIPNQLGLDRLDLEDALGAQEEYMCSADLADFIRENHLDLEMNSVDCAVNPRLSFGSHRDADHVYNTPRAWYMLRYFNPRSFLWDGEDADFRPEDDDLPWCLVPEHKITTEDVKYILSSHYQGTPYDPYATHGDLSHRNQYRTIGINRTETLGIVQIRPDLPDACRALQWICFGSNVFNAIAPFYPNVTKMPDYLTSATGRISTDNWFWTSNLIAALADASWTASRFEIEHYSFAVQSKARRVILETDETIRGLLQDAKEAKKTSGHFSDDPDMDSGCAADDAERVSGRLPDAEQISTILEQANEKIADILMEQADAALSKVFEAAKKSMKNRYARGDV